MKKTILLALLLLAVAGHAQAKRFTFVVGSGLGDSSQEAIQGATQQAISACLAQGGIPGNATTSVSQDMLWHASVFMDCQSPML